MAVEVIESGPSEEEVEAMVGKGMVQVRDVKVAEGKFGVQIQLSLQHRKGIEFVSWVTPSRPKICDLAKCFGVPSPGPGEKFQERSLVGRAGEVRMTTKTDSRGILRPKIDAWLPLKPSSDPKPDDEPKSNTETTDGIPF